MTEGFAGYVEWVIYTQINMQWYVMRLTSCINFCNTWSVSTGISTVITHVHRHIENAPLGMSSYPFESRAHRSQTGEVFHYSLEVPKRDSQIWLQVNTLSEHPLNDQTGLSWMWTYPFLGNIVCIDRFQNRWVGLDGGHRDNSWGLWSESV